MTDNLNEFIDLIYQGEPVHVPVEQMQLIGRALLLERQGQTPSQIAKEIGLNPQEVTHLVIRCKGWELSHQSEQD
jgi:orotate phosphoribosyltransferase-like protein